MTTLIVLLSVILLSQPKMNNYLSNSSYDTANNSAAQIERSVRRVWIKCTEAEKTNRKDQEADCGQGGTSVIEVQGRSKAGKAKWVNRGEEGRKQAVMDELESTLADGNCKVKKLKLERKSNTTKFKNKVSHNIFRRKVSKILARCKVKRDAARKIHDKSVEWLKIKYGECKMFKPNPELKPEEPSGPVIVCDVRSGLC